MLLRGLSGVLGICSEQAEVKIRFWQPPRV